MPEQRTVKRVRKPKVESGSEYCVKFDKDIARAQQKEGYKERLAAKPDKELTIPEWACVPPERSQTAILEFGKGYTTRGEEFTACSPRTRAVVLFVLLHQDMVHGNGFDDLWLAVAGRKLTSSRGNKSKQTLKYRLTQQLKLGTKAAKHIYEDDAEILKYAWGAPYANPDRSSCGNTEDRYNPSETNRAYACVQWALNLQWDKLDKSKRAPQQTELEYNKEPDKAAATPVDPPAVKTDHELPETPEDMGTAFAKLKKRIELFFIPNAKKARDIVLASTNLSMDGRERLIAIIEGLDYTNTTERLNKLKK